MAVVKSLSNNLDSLSLNIKINYLPFFKLIGAVPVFHGAVVVICMRNCDCCGGLHQ